MNGERNDNMNNEFPKPQADVLLALRRTEFVNQRMLAAQTGLSLGKVNSALHALERDGFLTGDKRPTERALAAFAAARPARAVILAAGSGLRMAPLSELPKGLLEVRGERLIDRLIRQLRYVGVEQITVVTGFMKEKYESLSNQPGIELIYNKEYVRKNNLHSLLLAADRLENAYVLPSDLWFRENPFSREELYAWYMLTSERSPESDAALNRRQELVLGGDDDEGLCMIGAAYLCAPASEQVEKLVRARAKKRRHQLDFWESVLLYPPCRTVYGRVVKPSAVSEINTFEELRSLDYSADQLSSSALDVIRETLHTPVEDISDVEIMKKGMTNRSFLFTAQGGRYIMRIPGEGSNVMINRAQEYAVYQAIEQTGLGDQIIHISPETGYKITAFWERARVCDPQSPADVEACMRVLRAFHEQRLAVPHAFDLFERIGYYESLRKGEASVFDDYARTRERVLALRAYIDAQEKAYCLTHIDAVPDNFLFIDGAVRLIDWEYAAMQDPHVDIAMFAVYSMYDRAHVEALIDSYFPEGCGEAARIKIYCYIAVCGLLWSNWCEYKRMLGVEFGEYALRQYRYAKQYYAVAAEAMERMGETQCT